MEIYDINLLILCFFLFSIIWELVYFVGMIIRKGIKTVRRGEEVKLKLINKKLRWMANNSVYYLDRMNLFWFYECTYGIGKNKQIVVVEPLISFYKKKYEIYPIWTIPSEDTGNKQKKNKENVEQFEYYETKRLNGVKYDNKYITKNIFQNIFFVIAKLVLILLLMESN